MDWQVAGLTFGPLLTPGARDKPVCQQALLSRQTSPMRVMGSVDAYADVLCESRVSKGMGCCAEHIGDMDSPLEQPAAPCEHSCCMVAAARRVV